MPEIKVKNSFFNVGDNVEMALEELRQAFEKHPNFCDKFTQQTLIHARYDERVIKRKNAEGPYFADRLLEEEICEARTAWLEGDKKHCKQELAQCIAVLLRMMELCD